MNTTRDLFCKFSQKCEQFEQLKRAPAIYLISGSFFYVMVGLCVKKLEGISATQILFLRCVISMCINSFFISVGKHDIYPKDIKTSRLLLLRCIVGGFAHICYYQAISLINLSDAQSIFLTSPIWTALLASVFLSEPLVRSTIFSIFLSFIGILFIVKPPFLLGMLGLTNQESLFDNPNLIYGFAASCAFSLMESFSAVIISSLSTVKVTAVVQYVYISGFSLNGLLMIASGEFNEKVYARESLFLIICVAVLNYSAQILYSRALQIGKTGEVVPLSYCQLVFSFGVDILIFDKSLSAMSLLGSGMILFCNFKIIFKNK